MTPRPRHPDLFGNLPDAAPRAAPEFPPAARPPQAWLAVHFPALALAALPPPGEGPRAVHAEEGRRDLIVAADEGARAAGVCPGLPVGSALALVPALQLQPRDTRAEALLLAALAGRCTALTPAVSLTPDALLLEVRASLRLFGGLASLVRRLTRALAGHALQVAAAPTARAALWLARAGRADRILEPAALPGALAALPVACTGWPETTLTLLGQIGVRTVGELGRLPRAGLARRLGVARLRELDEACGRVPDLRSWYVPPTEFQATAELPAEAADSGQLAAACAPLLAGLGAELARRQAGVRHLWCSLRHAGLPDRRPPDTRLRVALRRPTADPDRLRALLALRLAGVPLPAPVVAVVLQAPLVPGCPPTTADWHGGGAAAGERLAAVLDRLRARFGARGVRGLALHADHRPERAWRWTDAVPGRVGGPVPGAAGRRPPWLLAAPRRLPEAGGLPACGGPLVLADGPERIETGWWDGGDVRRDYFVAASRPGRCFWVFRDLRDGGWYLHGVFR